tara:strand:+ start:602 stop:1051 length:450 start_codon:yes stop_codon:yes gene_type:complete
MWQEVLKSPAKDRRYKLTQEDITQMNKLKEEGKSNTEIRLAISKRGKEISNATVIYWTDKEQREKQRAKNAKRKYVKGSLEDIARKKRDVDKRRENWKVDSDMRLRHEIQSAKDEKRSGRKTVRGMDIKDAKTLLSSGKLQRSNKKVEE